MNETINETILSICVDEYLDGEHYDKANQPSPVDMRSASREELALAKYKLWTPGQTLRIRFLDGSSKLHQRVEAHARQWLEHANLQFEFGNYPDAEIRVTFTGDGYRSLVGDDATRRPQPLPTMFLGGFHEATDDTEMQRVVLHEFGHALGCVHEQANPSITIPWNTEKVYAYYARHHHWDREMVDNNVLKRYWPFEVAYEAHDPKSIMQYPVSKELTLNGFEIGWNTELSDGDKRFIAQMYPKVTVPSGQKS